MNGVKERKTMKETRLVSIDSSTTCSGIALYINGKLSEYNELKPKSKNIEDRIKEMNELIFNQLKEYKPQILIYECPQGHGANVKLARNLGMVIGSIITYGAINKCDIHEVNPSEWRAWAGFNQGKLTRNELKIISIQTVKELFNIDGGDDLCDAILIGYGFINHCKEIDET